VPIEGGSRQVQPLTNFAEGAHKANQECDVCHDTCVEKHGIKEPPKKRRCARFY
jgi:hypothetical protein